MTDGDKKDGALTFGVRQEKARDVVIEKGEAGGAEPLRVGCEVQLAAQDARFQLHGAIAAIAEPLQNGAQIGQEKNVNGGIGGQILSQAEVPGIGTEISLL